jgi:DNA-binding GntR family transcriptional regulator
VFCIQILMRPILPEPDLSERIHDSVLEAICSGELKSGVRITQEDLANKFGVSRQPVLQAMMLLRREGFLIEAGRKGVCVAARLAAARYTPDLAYRGRLLLDVGRRAIKSGNVQSVIEADIDFHLFIYEASGNPLIGETAQPHWQHMRRVMAAALSEDDMRVSVWDEHEVILNTLEAGNALEAESLCRNHVEQMADILMGRLKVVISNAA